MPYVSACDSMAANALAYVASVVDVPAPKECISPASQYLIMMMPDCLLVGIAVSSAW
jgi:hypothetical protein